MLFGIVLLPIELIELNVYTCSGLLVQFRSFGFNKALRLGAQLSFKVCGFRV